MTELDKEKIKEVIESMVDGFNKEHLESPMFKHLIEKSEYLKDPDTMQTMIIYPFIKCVELAVSKTQNKSNAVVDLWMDYDFLESNVSELCAKFYGGGCSVDRGKFIVNSYIKFKETGIMPKLNWKQEYTFHYPKKGSLKQWFKFIEGINRLKYGYNDIYLKSLMELIKVHKKKVKHGKK
jgi:hypothetical protein